MSSHFTRVPRAPLLLASMLLTASACNKNEEATNANSNGVSSNGQKMTNVPGPVTESPVGSRNLAGHFEIRAAVPGDAFAFSSGTGGACLVTQYPASPKRCNQQTECALPAGNIGMNAASYCLPDDPGRGGGAVPPAGAGTCWVKPSDDFCLKPVGVGQHDTTPQDTTALAAAGMTKWRVLTCLNGAPGACRTGTPTPSEVQHQVGPVYTAP